jgi:hypothetical protein
MGSACGTHGRLEMIIGFGGMRIGKGNRVVRKDLPQCRFVHHKSYMT